jgi:hypothetical protein
MAGLSLGPGARLLTGRDLPDDGFGLAIINLDIEFVNV